MTRIVRVTAVVGVIAGLGALAATWPVSAQRDAVGSVERRAGAAVGVDTAAALRYPDTRKIEDMDDYHGTQVADPYRWLEDETSPRTAAWIEAQNAVTFPYLERTPYRGALLERVTEADRHLAGLVGHLVLRGMGVLLTEQPAPSSFRSIRARWRVAAEAFLAVGSGNLA